MMEKFFKDVMHGDKEFSDKSNQGKIESCVVGEIIGAFDHDKVTAIFKPKSQNMRPISIPLKRSPQETDIHL
jgi:hypothetical protein